MKKYKIVFIDIDDTLNPSNGKVTDYTKEVIKKIKEKGVLLVINTGRSLKYAINKSKEAGLSPIVISSNGSEIYNYEENKIIFNNKIPNDEILKMYNYCNSINTTLIFNTIKDRYINKKEYNYNNEPVKYIENINDVLANEDVNQLIILSNNYDRMLVIPRQFKEKFPNLKVVHSSINLIEEKRVKNKEFYHDLAYGNVTKGTGIVELLDYLKINSKDAIAIGNGYDDIPMMNVVDTKVAMGNAVENLKQVSNIIAERTENDGVAKILEKLILEEK